MLPISLFYLFSYLLTLFHPGKAFWDQGGGGGGGGGLIKAGRDGGVVDRADPRVEGAEPGRFVALVPPHDEVEPN